MKMRNYRFILLWIMLAAGLMTGCSTERHVISSSKPPVPHPKAPELGAGAAPQTAHDASRIAFLDLKESAKHQMAAGNLDQAFSTLEEALRINPNDPGAWHLLAQIQLQKGDLDQAEALARKSNLLAGKNKHLRRQNWRIIASALEQKGLTGKADAARRRAEKP